MGDQIEFPLNDRMYFEQAVKNIENNQFEDALDCLERVYVNDQSKTVNHLYTLILHTLNRNEEALDIANDQKDFYIDNEKHTVFYTMLLIKNQLFLEAEVLIQQYIANSHSIYFPEWQNLERELGLERELVHFEIEKQKKRNRKELRDIASYSPIKQAKIIEDAHALELKDLQEIAPSIFANPMASQMIQRAFLELLIEKNDPNEYKFLWFNQQKQVIPSKLEVFDQITTVKKLDKVLEDKLHKSPSLLELVKVEVMNDLLLLYPFTEEIVTDFDYWVDCYVEVLDYSNQLEVDSHPKTDEQKRINDWVQTFHQMTQRIQ